MRFPHLQASGSPFFLDCLLLKMEVLRSFETTHPTTQPNISEPEFLSHTTPTQYFIHCATSVKVAGSIPDGDIGIFYWHNTSERTMALRVDSSSNTNEYQRYFLGGKGDRCVGLTTLPPLCADWLNILGASTSWSPKGLSRPVQG
jgi:hypothetical protein